MLEIHFGERTERALLKEFILQEPLFRKHCQMSCKSVGRFFPPLPEKNNWSSRERWTGFIKQTLFIFFLFAFFLAIDFSGITARIEEIYRVRGGLLPLGFYLFTWCGLILSLFILYTNKSRLVRIFSFLISFFSLAVFFGYKFLNGYGYGYHEAIVTVNEYVFVREAISGYIGAAVCGIVVSVLFVLMVGYFCRTKLPETGKRYLLLVIFFIGCMGYIINLHADLVIENFPVVFNAPALICHAAQNRLYAGPRSKPYLVPQEAGVARHIVLIMDESIRGDHLSINGAQRDTTPCLESPGLQLLNLGIACSAGNQSSTSNIIVQSGLTLNQVPDLQNYALKMPSIFQYAKKCGRKTYYINAQGSVLSDYLTKQDLVDIDNYTFIEVENPDSPRWEYDLLAADLTRSILENDQSAFVYILKNGAHFPYEIMYPETGQVFEPAAISLTNRLLSRNNEEEILVNYDNAVRWSVDGFFSRLLPGLEKKSCLITYISDHGQSLGYKRVGMSIPHNTVEDPPVDQANTPMFLLLSEPAAASLGSERILSVLENKNRLSHFQVFPSLLYFMGYEKDEINEAYGPTIFDIVPDRRYFVSGDLFGRSSCRINLFEHKGEAGF